MVCLTACLRDKALCPGGLGTLRPSEENCNGRPTGKIATSATGLAFLGLVMTENYTVGHGKIYTTEQRAVSLCTVSQALKEYVQIS